MSASMTREQALALLAELAERKTIGNIAADRAQFIAWAAQGESALTTLLPPSDPLLQRYRRSIDRYDKGGVDVLEAVTAVLGMFDACKAVAEKVSMHELEGQTIASSPAPSIFISHSSIDAALANLVADLLQSVLRLAPTELRCTSVDAYSLDGGVDIDDKIRAEVLGAKVVIGLISFASLDSLYVAFELGARWGAGTLLIPILATGVPVSSIKSGPLGGKRALRLDNRSNLHRLVDQVGKELKIEPNPAASYQTKTDAIVSLANATPSPTEAPAARPGPLSARDKGERLLNSNADARKVFEILAEADPGVTVSLAHIRDTLANLKLSLRPQRLQFVVEALMSCGVVDGYEQYKGPYGYDLNSDGRALAAERGVI